MNTGTQQEEKPARFSGLDGLRAVAVGLVLLSHARRVALVAGFQLWAGYFGVAMFFVMSGFLITSLLAAELRASGRLDLRRFYVRRVLRIFPAFYAYLLVLAVLRALGFATFDWHGLLAPATFTANFVASPAPAVGHFWSLAVEEQFYLLWPVSLLLLGARRGAWLLAALVALAPVMFTIIWHLGSHHLAARWVDPIPYLGSGSVLALTRSHLRASTRYRAWLASRWTVGAAILALGVGHLGLGPGTTGTDLNRIELVGLALLTALAMDAATERSFGYAWLNWRWLAWLGTLSYSLYLWQGLFAHYTGIVHVPFPFDWLATLACAAASYYFVERPFLRLKRRFAPRRQPAIAAPACAAAV